MIQFVSIVTMLYDWDLNKVVITYEARTRVPKYRLPG